MTHHHLTHASGARWLPALDRFAIVLSAACAVHCVATPILLAVAPLLGSHAFENGMRLLLGGLAIVAVGFGTAVHGNWRTVPFLAVGIAILSTLWATDHHGDGELVLSLAASAALIVAHVLNSHACRARGRAGAKA